MTFQCPGGVAVPAPLDQNRAISVSSAVRRDPVLAHSAFTSFTSSAYRLLSRANGAGGRYSEAAGMPKGSTSPHHGSRAGRSSR